MKRADRSVVAQKRWVRDSDKELYWRTKISEWKKSGLSIRAFCHQREIVETSFYAWRRELAIRDRESAEANAVSKETDIPDVVKDSRGRLIPVKFREHQKFSTEHSELETEDPTFVQLKLASTSHAEKKSQLDVVCPNGLVIRIDQDVDLNFVSRVISVLE